MNQCQLIGRLTKTPELRQTPQGNAVTSFTIAINRKYKKGQADFIDVTAWKSVAEYVCKYFSKGQKIAIVGAIQSSTWEDGSGNNRKSVGVVANAVEFVDSARKKEADADGDEFDEFDVGDDIPF